MDREILFRGKVRTTGSWVTGWYCGQTNKSFFGEPVNRPQIIVKDDLGWAEVDPETVGQYTGLKDKNGVEIFEGDIVEQVSEYCSEVSAGDSYWDGVERADFFVRRRGVARIYPSKGAVITKQIIVEKSIDGEYVTKNEKQQGACNISQGRCVVIGNIYDNPELLCNKGKEK